MRLLLGYPAKSQHVEKIQQAAPQMEVVAAEQADLPQELPYADLFCGHVKVSVDWEAIVSTGRLRWIQSSAAGLDHCLHRSVIESPIVVSSASGVLADQVAEHTLALLGAVLRRLPDFHSAQQRREFVRQPTEDLHGKRVGIVGFGGVGRRIAELLAPYRVSILATDYFPQRCPTHVEAVLPPDGLSQLLQRSDIVILCVPLTPATRKMMGADQLELMPVGSVLVNVCRGDVLCESSLVEALVSGHLSAAAIDVACDEPPGASSLLWEAPRLVITPHVAGQSGERIDQMTDFLCENLRRYQADLPLLNLVDKQLGFPHPRA